MKIKWKDTVVHKKYDYYIILFYSSDINKKVKKKEYNIINFLAID